MNKKIPYIFGSSILALFIMFGVIGMFGNQGQQIGINNEDTTIKYSANVCTSVLRADGTYENLGCSPNLLTTAGKNLIKNYLGENGGAAVDYIALCNMSVAGGCTDPAVGDTTLDGEYTSGGLSRAQGTYNSNKDGNWSIVNTFTATGDALQTNMTGIFNASSTGTLFAENTFTSVTLQTNDKLTVNWTCGVST